MQPSFGGRRFAFPPYANFASCSLIANKQIERRKMIELDGGGQILRTALSLSMITGQAFHLQRIRARRPKPGLLRQHLTAVQA